MVYTHSSRMVKISGLTSGIDQPCGGGSKTVSADQNGYSDKSCVGSLKDLPPTRIQRNSLFGRVSRALRRNINVYHAPCHPLSIKRGVVTRWRDNFLFERKLGNIPQSRKSKKSRESRESYAAWKIPVMLLPSLRHMMIGLPLWQRELPRLPQVVRPPLHAGLNRIS